MEKLGVLQLVKYGFWLGVGFLVPLLVFTIGSTYLTMSSFSFPNYDISDQVAVQSYRARMDGNRVLILGSVINNSEQEASSIQIEAEFFDENGQFVYECSDFISQRLSPSQTENFQINCGCDDSPIPEYSEYTVQVTNANSF